MKSAKEVEKLNNDKLSFKEHVRKAVQKVIDKTKTLSRAIPNIGSPSMEKRKVLYGGAQVARRSKSQSAC